MFCLENIHVSNTTVVNVSMAETHYMVDEGNGTIEVCAVASIDLECSIVATLTPQNGNKAGKSGNTSISLILSEPFTFYSFWYGLQCCKSSCGDIHKWNYKERGYFMCTT